MACTDGQTKTLRLKRNDTLPKIRITVVERDQDNPGITTVVDLTGSTAKFIMVTDDDTRTVKVNAAATIAAPTTGVVEYSWISADTDTAGDYLGEFEITMPSGKLTLPNDDSLQIVIVGDYA